MRKIALLTGAVAMAGLAAACGDIATAAPAAAPATAPSTASSPAAAASTTTAAPPPTADAPAGPVATSRPAPGRTDWSRKVEVCPDDDQPVVVQQVVSGDLTGDGVADTAVARSCEARTSYWPSTVEVFDGASGSRIATLLADDGPTYMPWVTRLAVSRGTLTVEAAGNDAHGSQACADLGLTYTFAYRNGKLTRTDRVIGDAGKCQDVG
jgi:hypothetical protein